ncbi:MAG: YdcF family protein [Acidobacteria bacterium]|nr:YdcF family protein [Acidobacteriota bacterium]
MTAEERHLASTVFDYHQLSHKPATADAMLVLGTNDTRVAGHAADLFLQGFAPLVVITGGIAHQNDLLSTSWHRPEAEVFAEILRARGVPSSALLLECKATNTGENIRFSRQLLANHTLSRILIVTKPFMQRRAFATHAVEWPEMPATMSSWSATFDDYCTHPDLDPVKVTNIILGDLQRLWLYSRLGYSAPQRIPADVMTAFHKLVELGFDRHLLPE